MNTTALPAPELRKQEQKRQINSSDLFRGQRMVEIHHQNQRYTLRITRENKLLLTK